MSKNEHETARSRETHETARDRTAKSLICIRNLGLAPRDPLTRLKKGRLGVGLAAAAHTPLKGVCPGETHDAGPEDGSQKGFGRSWQAPARRAVGDSGDRQREPLVGTR